MNANKRWQCFPASTLPLLEKAFEKSLTTDENTLKMSLTGNEILLNFTENKFIFTDTNVEMKFHRLISTAKPSSTNNPIPKMSSVSVRDRNQNLKPTKKTKNDLKKQTKTDKNKRAKKTENMAESVKEDEEEIYRKVEEEEEMDLNDDTSEVVSDKTGNIF